MLARAQIHNGKLVLQYDSAVERLFKANDGKRIWVDIHVDRPKRSNEQNRYYWGVLVKLVSESTGYTPEEVHELHKVEFMPGQLKTVLVGDVAATVFVGSTKKLTTVQFNEFIEKLVKFYAEQDIYIPLPNEVEMVAGGEV